MRPDISLIIPYLNEEENIHILCETLDKHAQDKPYILMAIFVDDGSTDNTTGIIKSFIFSNIQAKIIKLSKNYGSHAAWRAGIAVADSKYCMFFSADMQEPVELIDTLYAKIQEGYDIVAVEKGQVKTKRVERFFSRLFAMLVRMLAIPSFPNGGVNTCIFNEKVTKIMNAHAEPNSSVILQLLSLGYRTTFIVCDYLERKYGRSKWTLGKKIKMMIDAILSFSFVPVRIISVIGITFSLLGFFYGIYIVIVKLFNLFALPTGWPTLISLLMLGFGITNISLGIIAEYLWRTLDVSRNRPVFLIDQEILVRELDNSDESNRRT